MPRIHIHSILPGWLLVGCLAGTVTAEAQQDVFAPPPPSPSSAPQQFGVRMISDPSLIFGTSSESPFQWGSFILKPHFLYRFLYGDGIQASPGHQLTTATNSFAPGFLLDMGSQWTLDYTPTWNVYSNSAFHDNLGEAVSLQGATSFEDWALRFNQGYIYSSQPLVETGRQTSEEDFTTGLSLSRRLGQQFSSETILNQDLRYAVGFPSTKQWSALEWLHYEYVSQLDTAVGASLGYTTASQGSDVLSFSPQAQATWVATEKLSLSVNGGLDHREFLEHPRTILNTPTYNVTVQYNPFEWTGISLAAGHQVEESYFANESTKNTTWRAGLSQRLLEHYLLTASVGHNDGDYLSNVTAGNAGRSDKTLSYNLRLTWSFLQRGSFAVLYQWDRNSSNVSGFRFLSHQVGLEIGYRY